MNTKLLSSSSSRSEFWIQFVVLYLITVIAQLSNVAYQKFLNNESFVSTLAPSLLFLSVITIPALLIGFKLGRQLGLGLVNSKAQESQTLADGIRFAVITAIGLGFVLLAIRWGVSSSLPRDIPEYGFRGPVGGLMVSFGAGIGEEVWFRFGLMTLMLYLGKQLTQGTELPKGIVVFIILFVGVFFGLTHVPQLMSYGVGDAFSIWATIIGNVCVSVLYGWCYWRYGLISAIVAHVSLDLVLHVLPTLF